MIRTDRDQDATMHRVNSAHRMDQAMLISLIQTNCGSDKAANIRQIEDLASQAITETGPRLISLAEGWSCMGGSIELRREQAELLPDPGSGEAGGPAYEALRNIAKRHKVFVHGGSIIELTPDSKMMNTTIVFDPAGVEIARYRKIHMFDIVTPDGLRYGESDVHVPGTEIVTCDIDGIRVGLAICYDLRFPELFRALRDRGAELIFLPSAFTLQTGKDHWHPLLRARAIETQCWIAAAGMTGPHYDAQGQQRMTFGHSLICDPWGHITAQASEGVGFVTGRLDQRVTQRVRGDIPVHDHHRLPFPARKQS